MQGSCLCGAVKFTLNGPVDHTSACHCSMCRKQSGHFWAAGGAAAADIAVTGDVRWYAASAEARRGFCPVCGSLLFWQANGSDTIAFALGAIDGPTGLRLEKHIYTADKGDYYDIADGVPQE